MTTNQITALARAKMLEATSEVISDGTILLYANLAQQDIFKRAFPSSQILTATITFVNGVGTLPTYFGTLYGDAKRGESDFYPELSIEDFNKRTLSQSVTVEGGTMKVYPTTTTSLEIKYHATFPDMTSAVNPTIDSYFHELIVYGILQRAFEDLQDFDVAKAFGDKYEAELAKKIAVQSNYEEGNQRASQMFSSQDLLGGGLGRTDPNFF